MTETNKRSARQQRRSDGRSWIGTPGLVARYLLSDVGTPLLVALLVFVAVLAAALAPRALTALATAELKHEVSVASPALHHLKATAVLGGTLVPEDAVTVDDVFAGIDRRLEILPEFWPDTLASAHGESAWFVSGPKRDALPLEPRSDTVPDLSLVIDLDWASRVRIVDGAAPSRWSGTDADDLEPFERPPLDIALSVDAAEAMTLEVGDLLESPTGPLHVSALFVPLDPTDPYWLHAPEIFEGLSYFDGMLQVVIAGAYIDPGSVLGLRESFVAGTVFAYYPTRIERLDYADVDDLVSQLDNLMAMGEGLNSAVSLSFRSGLADLLRAVDAKVTAMSSLLALTASGSLGVVFAVLALGVQSLVRRRQPALSLASARGVSSLRLRLVMLLEGLLVGVPAGLAGMALAAVWLPERVDPTALVLPLLITVATPVLCFATNQGASIRRGRTDAAVRSRSRIRWIIEAIVIGLAVLSLFLLARRGLVPSSQAVGIDPLLAGAPLLLSAAASVIVLRIYPFPLLAVQRLAHKARGAVSIIGAARAVREPALGAAAAFALVVGISVTVLTLVLSTTTSGAMVAAAEERVGADVRVDSSRIDEQFIEVVSAADGVDTAVGIEMVPRRMVGGSLGTEVTVLVADTDQLRLLRPGLAAGLDETRDGSIPMVVSSDLAEWVGEENTMIDGRPATVAGTMPKNSMAGASGRWILIDERFVHTVSDEPFDPTWLLVDVDGEPAAAASAVQAAITQAYPEYSPAAVTIHDTQSVLDDARQAPVIAGLDFALALAAMVALALSALTVVVASVAAAASRHRMLSVLRMLGMSRRQAGALVLWEIGPVAVTAIVAGTALGLGLPWLVTNVVDLSAFVGGTVRPLPLVDPLAVSVSVLGFVMVAALAGVVAMFIGRRLDPNRFLRIGSD